MNLQQIPWAFSFTIREVLAPDYEAIGSSAALLTAPPAVSEEERTRLLEEKQQLLVRLDLYKKKLGASLTPPEQEGAVDESLENLKKTRPFYDEKKSDGSADVLLDRQRKSSRHLQQTA